jgi:hypothetical protein
MKSYLHISKCLNAYEFLRIHSLNRNFNTYYKKCIIVELYSFFIRLLKCVALTILEYFIIIRLDNFIVRF